jgi:ketosteroid isomerase-like protein
MSQKNVEKVRRGFAEYNRGDVEGALQEWAYRGRDEIRAFWQQRSAAWEEDRLEIVDLVEVGEDRVIVENVAYLRNRGGMEVEARSAWLVTFQDGEQTLYQTMREALEASGVSE